MKMNLIFIIDIMKKNHIYIFTLFVCLTKFVVLKIHLNRTRNLVLLLVVVFLLFSTLFIELLINKMINY